MPRLHKHWRARMSLKVMAYSMLWRSSCESIWGETSRNSVRRSWMELGVARRAEWRTSDDSGDEEKTSPTADKEEESRTLWPAHQQANGGAVGNQLLVWEQLQELAEKTKRIFRSQNRGEFLWYQHTKLKIHQQFLVQQNWRIQS